MPPKLDHNDTQLKLEELRNFVRQHAPAIAPRAGTTLVSALRQNASAEEKQWYKFLLRSETVFNEQHKEHINETFKQLRSTCRAPPPTDDTAPDMGMTYAAPLSADTRNPAEQRTSGAEAAGSSDVQPSRATAWTITKPGGGFSQQLLIFPQEAAYLLQTDLVEEVETGDASSRRLSWTPGVEPAIQKEMLLAAFPSGKRRDNVENMLSKVSSCSPEGVQGDPSGNEPAGRASSSLDADVTRMRRQVEWPELASGTVGIARLLASEGPTSNAASPASAQLSGASPPAFVGRPSYPRTAEIADHESGSSPAADRGAHASAAKKPRRNPSSARTAMTFTWLITTPSGSFNKQFLLFPEEAAHLVQANVVDELETGDATSRRLDWKPGVGVATRQEMFLAALPPGKRRDNVANSFNLSLIHI